MADRRIHFLVDYENVGNSGLTGVEYLLPEDAVTIFYNASMKKVSRGQFDQIEQSGCDLELTRLVKSRSNALDFYIASKTGLLFGQGYRGIVAIVSRDGGFKSVQDYFQTSAASGRVVLGGTLGQCIVAAKLGDERSRAVVRDSVSVDLEAAYARYEERRRLRRELEKQLVSADPREVVAFQQILEEGGENRKGIYLDSLRRFGRKRGLELYRQFGAGEQMGGDQPRGERAGWAAGRLEETCQSGGEIGAERG